MAACSISTVEISDAWLRTWDKASAPWNDGSNPLLARPVGAGVAADGARALEATQVEVVG